MAKKQHENLFLLEFLVDELKMESRCDCAGNTGEICISFQFLDNEALDVCEGDFNCDKKFGENDNSKTGKSCLFSLTQAQAQKILNSFDVNVCVFKKMQQGWQPDKTCIGSAVVSILPLFRDLIKNPEAATAAKILQDTYSLVDTKGMVVGKIGIYIRLSCYGKMIITQFQMNMDDKSVLFKDKDGHSLYRYKKSKKGKATKIEDLSQKSQQCPPQGHQTYDQMMYGGGQYPPPNPNCPMQPCFPPQAPTAFSSSPNMNYPVQQSMPPCFPPPNPNCPMQPCFPEYGMQMQGFDACPAPSRTCQVSFAQKKSACGGKCGRG